MVREVEAIVAVGVGPIGGRDVSRVAFGVVGSHMILVDDPDVGFVDTHALLVVAGGRERRVARRVDDLDVAIFMQLHLPAKKRGARRGDVGLKSELDNHHAVGRRAEELFVDIDAVGRVTGAAHKIYFWIVGSCSGRNERRTLVARAGHC